MKDPEKNMPADKHKDEHDKRVSPHSSYLTVMVIKNVGKVRSFKISSRILLWSTLFLVLYIIGSIIVICGYFSVLRTSRTQIEQLKQVNQEIEDTKRTLYRSRQRLAFMEDYIHGIEAGHEKKKKADRPVPERQIPKRPEITDKKTVKTVKKIVATQEVEKEAKEELVDVKELTIRKQGTDLTVNFKLVNVDPNKRPVRGYVYVIAMNKETDPPRLSSCPKAALQNGVPVNHKKGQYFVIKRFKTITGKYVLDPESITPSSIEILVYNKPGKLIFKKEFEAK